jgi:hypothetical protein
MQKFLSEGYAQFDKLMNEVVFEANRYLSELDTMPVVAVLPTTNHPLCVSDERIGALETSGFFKQRYASWIPAVPPRGIMVL